MLALISFLIIVLISLIAVKIGSIALESTGLSKDISQFQSQSAFSGIGFTTEESETIMSNPIRRKIIRVLMFSGSAGITTAMATLVLTLLDSTNKKVNFLNYSINSMFFNVSTILVVLICIFLLSKTKHFDKLIRWFLEKPLHMIKKKAMLFDYEKVLGLSKGYSAGTFEIPKHHWMVNKNIKELEIEKEGIMILGVYRKVHGHEEYIGIPSKDFKVHNRDKIVAFGREDAISNLAKREKGAKGSLERKKAELLHKEYEILKKIDEDKMAIAAKSKNKS